MKGKRRAGIPSPDRADAILTRTCTLFNIARGQTVSNRCCHTTFAVDASSSALLATARSDGAHILFRQALPGTLQHGASIFGWTEPPQGLELLFGDVLADRNIQSRLYCGPETAPIEGGFLVGLSKQLSVFLENKPGRLANVLLTLARDKVNITALTVMDSHEHNVLRFVSDELEKTRQVLKELSIPFAETEVVVVEMRNQPGELAHVCEILAAEHINIEYAYCSAGGRNGKTVGIFKVSNAAKAVKIVGESPNNSARRRLQQRPLRSRQSYQSPGAAKR